MNKTYSWKFFLMKQNLDSMDGFKLLSAKYSVQRTKCSKTTLKLSQSRKSSQLLVCKLCARRSKKAFNSSPLGN